MIGLPLPEPAAGLKAYSAELTACLTLDERKHENYRLYQEADRRSAKVNYLPVKLDIENVSRCNFACTMCAVSLWNKRQRARDMCLHEFKALIDEQYGLVEIKLNGLGEALMQGDDYFEMIRYARARRIWVRMTTNASLLNVSKNYGKPNYVKLIESGVNEIDISIDGADKATFEAIRVGGKFKIVTRNCKLLNDYAKSVGKPSAKMWTLVQRGNSKNLYSHVELAAQLGFQHLVFSLSMHGWGDDALAERNEREQSFPTEGYLRGLIQLGETIGVRVAFWTVADKFTPESLCPWPFQRAVVTSDLRTVPCCMVGDPNKFEIGRDSGKGFTELWQGKEYEAFRQSHLDGAIPKICKGCYRD
jgi:pyrroloquinoline quinone biosynthesis protein E